MSVAGYVFHIRKRFNIAASHITFTFKLQLHEQVESTSRSLATCFAWLSMIHQKLVLVLFFIWIV